VCLRTSSEEDGFNPRCSAFKDIGKTLTFPGYSVKMEKEIEIDVEIDLRFYSCPFTHLQTMLYLL